MKSCEGGAGEAHWQRRKTDLCNHFILETVIHVMSYIYITESSLYCSIYKCIPFFSKLRLSCFLAKYHIYSSPLTHTHTQNPASLCCSGASLFTVGTGP